MTPEQLWDKYSVAEMECGRNVKRVEFLAAIAEHGEAVRAENAELRKDRLADIRLSISHLGQIYGLLNEGKVDEASDYCRAAADSWTQDIDELSEAIDRARSANDKA